MCYSNGNYGMQSIIDDADNTPFNVSYPNRHFIYTYQLTIQGVGVHFDEVTSQFVVPQICFQRYLQPPHP